jgi:D-xylose 1-dehydrogenase (NADP+, D-xylono-1,5-lactone-forming)
MRTGFEPVQFGIISTAAINAHVLAGVANSASVEILAVASRSQVAADAYAVLHEIPRAHGSYAALLADPDVEAIYVPLPNSLHIEWAVLALEAGKHVICEKPLDRRLSEVERAFHIAERAGLILTEAFMYRHHPQTARFADLAATEIGRLRTIRASLGGTLVGADNVRLRTDLDGGALMDVGCYCVSAARLLGGEPEVAIGRRIVGPSGVDMRFAGLLTFPDDVIATFDCGFDLAPTAVVEAVGSRGTVRAVDPFLLQSSAIELTTDGTATQRIEVPVADSYRLEFENLAAAIRGTGAPLLGKADAIGQARALEALHRSAENGGEPVHLD